MIDYVLVCAGLYLAAVLFVRKASGQPLTGFVFNDSDLGLAGDFPLRMSPAVETIMEIVRYAMIPLFALLYGYFRIAEKEARDEVQ